MIWGWNCEFGKVTIAFSQLNGLLLCKYLIFILNFIKLIYIGVRSIEIVETRHALSLRYNI